MLDNVYFFSCFLCEIISYLTEAMAMFNCVLHKKLQVSRELVKDVAQIQA